MKRNGLIVGFGMLAIGLVVLVSGERPDRTLMDAAHAQASGKEPVECNCECNCKENTSAAPSPTEWTKCRELSVRVWGTVEISDTKSTAAPVYLGTDRCRNLRYRMLLAEPPIIEWEGNCQDLQDKSVWAVENRIQEVLLPIFCVK